MTNIKSGYDLSPTTYSPEGRVFQVEYASKLVNNSSVVLGLICNNGLLIVAEKDSDTSTNENFFPEKIVSINNFSAIGATGRMGDIKYIVQRAKVDNLSYRESCSESLHGFLFAARIGSLIHMHSIYWHLRPFACSGIIGTISDSSPEIFIFFPSGFFVKCFATAIGKHSEMFKISLDNILTKLNSCRKNIKEISKVLKKIKSKINLKKLEIFSFSKEIPNFDIPISYNIIIEAQRQTNFCSF